jgi:hypothetical protein
LCFNVATLIAGVFVLDYGADKFIDHTVIVGRRLMKGLARIDIGWDCTELQTSSHSAPAVKRAMTVCECFNVATLIAGVFVLDYGADKFIDHTVIVGRRLGISQTVIALLTAGAEWEEAIVKNKHACNQSGNIETQSIPIHCCL